MKKVYSAICLFFAAILFMGCDGLLDGENFKNKLQEEIDYANAPVFNVSVNFYKAEDLTSIFPVGQVECKAGYAFSIEAKIAEDHNFTGWSVIDKLTGEEIQNKEEYFSFTEAKSQLNGTEDTRTVKVTVLKESQNLEIVPFCSFKNDVSKPEFYGEFNISSSKENFDNAEYLSVKEDDLKDNHINGRLYFKFKAIDKDRPASVLVKETLLKNDSGETVSDKTKSKLYENKFTVCGRNLYETEIEHELELEEDGIVQVDIFVVDANGNVSEKAQSYKIIKDTIVKNRRLFLYSNHVMPGSNNSISLAEEINASKFLYWSGEVDAYFNGTEIVFEKINRYRVSWGADENCTEGYADIDEDTVDGAGNSLYEDKTVDLGFTEYEDYKYREWHYKLPDAVYDRAGDLFVCVEAFDELGNSLKKGHVIVGEQEYNKPWVNHYGSDPVYHMSVQRNKDAGAAEDSTFKNGYFLNMYYHVFYSKAEGDAVTIFNAAGTTGGDLEFYRFLTETISVNDDVHVNSYKDANPGDVIGYMYIQPVYVKTDQSYYDFFADDPQGFSVLEKYGDYADGPAYGFEHFGKKTGGVAYGGNVLTGKISRIELKKGFMLDKEIGTYEEAEGKTGYYAGSDFIEVKDNVINTCVIENGVKNSQIIYFDFSAGGSAEEIAEYNWYIYEGNDKVTKGLRAETYEIISDACFQLYGFNTETGWLEVVEEKTIGINPIENDTAAPYWLNNIDCSINGENGIVIRVQDFGSGLTTDENGREYIKTRIIPYGLYKWADSIPEEELMQYPEYKVNPRRVNGYCDEQHFFTIPLYLYEKGILYMGYIDASDKKGNRLITNVDFQWNKYPEAPVVVVTEEEGSWNKAVVKQKVNRDIESNAPGTVLEMFDTTEGIWSYDYSNPHSLALEEDADTVKSNDFYIDKESFYRMKVVNEAPTDHNTYIQNNYFNAPVIFYGGKVTVNTKMAFPGTNGVKIESDQPVLVQTVYANRNLGVKAEDWELEGVVLNTRQYNPVTAGATESFYYYYDDVTEEYEKIPEGAYYVAIIYFVDNSKTITYCMNK